VSDREIRVGLRRAFSMGPGGLLSVFGGPDELARFRLLCDQALASPEAEEANKRSPASDPKPGDVVGLRYHFRLNVRRVVSVDQEAGTVTYQKDPWDRRTSPPTITAKLKAWVKWCAAPCGLEVLRYSWQPELCRSQAERMIQRHSSADRLLIDCVTRSLVDSQLYQAFRESGLHEDGPIWTSPYEYAVRAVCDNNRNPCLGCERNAADSYEASVPEEDVRCYAAEVIDRVAGIWAHDDELLPGDVEQARNTLTQAFEAVREGACS
jgi:hypothetical protein